MNRHATAPLLLVSLLLASVIEARDPDGLVSIQTAEGQAMEGRLESLQDGQLKLENETAVHSLADLFRIDWPGRSVLKDAKGPVLLFVNGDRIAVRPTQIAADTLTGNWVHLDAWPAVQIPLETLRACVFQLPATPGETTRLFNRLEQPTLKSDAILLQNGDTLTGEFQSGNTTELVIRTAAGMSTVPISSVVALAFNPELTLQRPLKGLGGLATLIDGSRLRLTALQISPAAVPPHNVPGGGTLACETAFGARLEIPLTALSSLQILGGRVVSLGDLPPAQDNSQPYLSLAWPYRVNRSVTGAPLRLRGREFATGLGVHSRSELTWNLNGEYRRFLATVGVDDDAGGQGSVIFRVLVDGKPVVASKVLTGASEPLPLEPVDLTKARTLTLIVEFATYGDILDHADWCNARLVR